jgi:hypothetical protein
MMAHATQAPLVILTDRRVLGGRSNRQVQTGRHSSKGSKRNMSTVFDPYFAILDSDVSSPEFARLGDMFAPDAELLFGGDFAAGPWIVEYHKQIATRRQRSTHTFAITADADGIVAADFQVVGVDPRGEEYRASGTATATLDAEGRITDLKVVFADHSDFAWRYIIGHNQAWRETDSDARQPLLRKVYSEDFTFTENDVIHGLEGYNEWINRIHALAPIAMVYATGQNLRNRDTVLYEWFLMNPDGSTVTGWETQHIDGDGKIDHIILFPKDMGTMVGAAA